MVRFGESVSFDARLAPFDVQGSKAQAKMLAHIGILSTDEAVAICDGLDALLKEIEAGNFTWDAQLEDVHMNIEKALTARVPAAAKLHTARSRNDQVATDMRLWFKWATEQLQGQLEALIAAFVDKAGETRAILIPGYTHLQRAQPVSAAHHLLAYVEMLARDYERLSLVWEAANVCPLGSGAIAGSTLPVDREFVARELGFVNDDGEPILTHNSMDAVSDRDVFIEFASTAALCGVHLSRLAEDMILWSSSEFGFAKMPESFTTGSSLMPQKRNPDAMELIRGKSARLQGSLQTLLTLAKGLPLTYNRDLQEDKPPVFDAFDQLALCLEVATHNIAGLTMQPERCAAAVADPLLLATDLADFLVEQGVAFRDAHHQVGALVALAEKTGTPLDKLDDAEAKAAAPGLGEGDAWRAVFNLKRSQERRKQTGMPAPERLDAELAKWREWLA